MMRQALRIARSSYYQSQHKTESKCSHEIKELIRKIIQIHRNSGERYGAQLCLEVEMTRVRGVIGKGKVITTVDGEIVCETEITFAFGDEKE